MFVKFTRMSLIPVCLPNPGWRMIWGRQKEPGNAICNLGVDSEVVQHSSGFVSLHFDLVSRMGNGLIISCPPFTPYPGVLWSRLLPDCLGLPAGPLGLGAAGHLAL